uniref:Transcription initiation factor TFIID component TAF4 C-terminal domain-containing protein n=1 Tax=Fagus sylvatica TaxID=28930 RepID=A0A2N9J274_FAGSY
MGHQPSVSTSLIHILAVQVQPDSSPSARKNCDQETGEVVEHQLDLQRMLIPSAITSVQTGTNANTSKKRSFVQEKRIKAFVTPSPPSSKRQKLSRKVPDQRFELPDDLSLCGNHLQEEEEQLFSQSKTESQASETPRTSQVKEDERLILQKLPLQKKLAQIIAKCGIESKGNDVECFLSLAVKKRMDGLIGSMIRLSKQRVDFDKPKNQIVHTSDIQHQISVMNLKLKEDQEKKQTEEAAKEFEADGDTYKAGRSSIIPKENTVMRVLDDSKCRKANIVVRAEIGIDDVVKKWKLMAEKHNRKLGRSSGTQASKDAREEKGTKHQLLGRSCLVPQMKMVRSLSVKDLAMMVITRHWMSDGDESGVTMVAMVMVIMVILVVLVVLSMFVLAETTYDGGGGNNSGNNSAVVV